MFRLFRNAAKCVLFAGSVAVLAPAAEAGYTAVKQPTRKAEVSHEQILERVYGGDFVGDPTGLSFSNESGVTVTRLQDGPGGDDTLSATNASARAVAAFSGRRRTAGYFGARTGGGVHTLVNASGRQFDVAGTGAAAIDGTLVFGRNPRKTAKAFSSVASSNRDGMDHLVTYEVKGSAAQAASVYLLCWEDKLAGRSDRDYNDLVIEVEAGQVAGNAPISQPLLIPLPPGAWTGLAGLLGLGALHLTRRRPGVGRSSVATY